MFEKDVYFMFKKISLFVLCGIVLFGICGCDNKQKHNVSNNKENNDLIYVGTLVGMENESVILTNGNYLITNNNNLYSVSFDKLFSNDTNYKQIDIDYKPVGIAYIDFDLYSIYDSNNNWGVCSEKGCPNSLDKKQNNTKIKLRNSGLYVDDKNSVYFSKLDSNDWEFKGNELIENNSIPKDEEIIAIYYGNGGKLYLKTNKGFYVYEEQKNAINKDECEKYVDITCEYNYVKKITKENVLSTNYENIKFIVNDKIVFNDNKIYMSKQ